VLQIVIKGACSLLMVWGLYLLWPGKGVTGGRMLTWRMALVLAAVGLALLWRWDVDASGLLSKPIQLLSAIERTLSSASRHSPDGLYQHGAMVGLGEGSAIDKASGRVTFKAISHANHLNPGGEIEYREWKLKCPVIGGEKDVNFTGTTMRVFTDVQCEIVGKRASS
jgi:hypothetical protein